MKKNYSNSIFIFRRDLRLEDNTGLIEALNLSDKVTPLFLIDNFILQKRVINKKLLQFLTESLKDLNKHLKKKSSGLSILKGHPSRIISNLLKEKKIDAIFTNRNYSPYSIKREMEIKQICSKNAVAFHSLNDYLLNEPENVLTSKGTPYTVFTPYFRKVRMNTVRYPLANTANNYDPDVFGNIDVLDEISRKKSLLNIKPGRKECLDILSNLTRFNNYEVERDYPSKKRTTHLSPYLKFGTCSIREAYHRIKTVLGNEHPLIRQLYWRDFFVQIGYYFPRVFNSAFREKFNEIKWQNNMNIFELWCNGKTGFPIVDAGMRELNSTGYMHNRVRMIVSSFLVKDLHLDWRKGEEYFANKLIDLDIAVNNGNWQWTASTGCDAQPYFRIFNPWIQQRKYDPDCKYIKKWIPELKEVKREIIHNWFKQKETKSINYPQPIVDHNIESKFSKQIYTLAGKRREEKT